MPLPSTVPSAALKLGVACRRGKVRSRPTFGVDSLGLKAGVETFSGQHEEYAENCCPNDHCQLFRHAIGKSGTR